MRRTLGASNGYCSCAFSKEVGSVGDEVGLNSGPRNNLDRFRSRF